MHKTAAALGLLSLLLCSGTALAGRDVRVKKAIALFDRAEFTKAKDMLATLTDAPDLSEEDRLQTRIYLAASYFGLGDRASAKAQFLALARRYPRLELDPGLFLPEVVDLFREARAQVVREGGGPGSTGAPGAGPGGKAISGAPGPSGGKGMQGGGARWSPMTFVPFGVGQFHRGDALFGHIFLWSEVGTLALAAGAKIHFQSLKRAPSRPWDFSTPAYVEDVTYARRVQNVFAGALIASGVIAVAGVAEAAVRSSGPKPLSLRVEPSFGGIAVRF